MDITYGSVHFATDFEFFTVILFQNRSLFKLLMNSAIKRIVRKGDISRFHRNISRCKMFLNLSKSAKMIKLASSQNCKGLPFCYLFHGDMTGEELICMSKNTIERATI